MASLGPGWLFQQQVCLPDWGWTSWTGEGLLRCWRLWSCLKKTSGKQTWPCFNDWNLPCGAPSEWHVTAKHSTPSWRWGERLLGVLTPTLLMPCFLKRKKHSSRFCKWFVPSSDGTDDIKEKRRQRESKVKQARGACVHGHAQEQMWSFHSRKHGLWQWLLMLATFHLIPELH